MQDRIELKWAEENKQETRKENINKMVELFKRASFNTIWVKVIPNEYSDHPCYYGDPWLIVTTTKGPIKIGWRKRVINIDWSESDIEADGNQLFKGENVTTGLRYVHAWSCEKAIEYLTKLNETNI